MTKKKDPINADPIDERQEAIRESRKWSKSIAKVVKKVKKKDK
jgi:hypothetical protein